MNQLYLSEPSRLKKLMEHWFLHYYQLNYEGVDGMGVFSIYDKMPSHRREEILSKLTLLEHELLVLVLNVGQDEYIVNTTGRFIRLQNNSIGCLNYLDFNGHASFKSLFAGQPGHWEPINVKKEGYLSDFGLRLKNGEIVYWKIPTGRPGFGFWNITKRCRVD